MSQLNIECALQTIICVNKVKMSGTVQSRNVSKGLIQGLREQGLTARRLHISEAC